MVLDNGLSYKWEILDCFIFSFALSVVELICAVVRGLKKANEEMIFWYDYQQNYSNCYENFSQ
jgi:hypothetical protein